jgi:hypothetical protein
MVLNKPLMVLPSLDIAVRVAYVPVSILELRYIGQRREFIHKSDWKSVVVCVKILKVDFQEWAIGVNSCNYACKSTRPISQTVYSWGRGHKRHD